MPERVLEHDDIYPRDEEHRYRLYARTPESLRVLVAAASMPAIGLAIQTLHEDARAAGRRLADEGRIGIFDAIRREWLVLPWDRGGIL